MSHTQEHLDWAKAQVKEIMEGTSLKTLYKQLLALPTELLEVEMALLYVAQKKASSYHNAINNPAMNPTTLSFNWVGKDSQLAQAELVLHHKQISTSDIAMYVPSTAKN